MKQVFILYCRYDGITSVVGIYSTYDLAFKAECNYTSACPGEEDNTYIAEFDVDSEYMEAGE